MNAWAMLSYMQDDGITVTFEDGALHFDGPEDAVAEAKEALTEIPFLAEGIIRILDRTAPIVAAFTGRSCSECGKAILLYRKGSREYEACSKCGGVREWAERARSGSTDSRKEAAR